MENDHQLNARFATLREIVATPELRLRILDKLIGVRKPRTRTWLLAAVPVAGVTVAAIMLMSPRKSVADVLRQAKAAQETVVAYELKATQKSKAKEEPFMTITADGNDMLVEYHKKNQFFGGTDFPIVRTYFKDEKTVYIGEEFVLVDSGTDGRVPRIEEWFDLLQKSKGDVKLVSGVIWNGREFEALVIEQPFAEGRIRNTYYFDPQTHLCAGNVAVTSAGVEYKSEIRYEGVDRNKMVISIPQGLPVYDLVRQREEIAERLASPVSRVTVGKTEIACLGVWTDVSGGVVAFTMGDAGLPPKETPALEIIGMKGTVLKRHPGAKGSSLNWNTLFRYRDGSSWFKPRRLQGVGMVAHAALFQKPVPSRVTIRVKVWTKEGGKGTSILFRNVPVVRTVHLARLLNPHGAVPSEFRR